MFTIIVDTREKMPWTLTASTIDGAISKKLDTGDYSIEGYEDKVCIERKRDAAELAANVCQARFKSELERMMTYEYRYLILEFNIQDVLDYPVGSSVPPARWKKLKTRGPYIMKCISQFQVKYGINVVFAGNSRNAEYAATNIMKRIYERLHTDSPEN